MVRHWTIEGSKDAINKLEELVGIVRFQECENLRKPLVYQWWSPGKSSYLRVIDDASGELYTIPKEQPMGQPNDLSFEGMESSSEEDTCQQVETTTVQPITTPNDGEQIEEKK